MALQAPPAMVEHQSNAHESPEISVVRRILISQKETKEAQEEMRTIGIYRIKDGVFALVPGGKNINRYVDANGEPIFNLKPLIQDRFFEKTSKFAGYKNIKTPDGIYNLYHSQDIVNGIPKSGAKPVDKLSIEYFEFWVGQVFYRDRNVIDITATESLEKHFAKVDDELLTAFLEHGALTIHDVLSFRQHEQITDSQLQRALADIQKWLPLQSADVHGRFHKCGIYIRAVDLKSWMEQGLIPKDLAEKCLKIVEERDKREFETSKAKGVASLDIRDSITKLGLETIDQGHSVAWVQFNTRNRTNTTLQA